MMTLKAGGHRFKSHLSSLFFYEKRKEKRGLSGSLPCLLGSAVHCVYIPLNECGTWYSLLAELIYCTTCSLEMFILT